MGNKQPTAIVKIATFILLVGGLLTFIAALTRLTVLTTSNNFATLNTTVEKLINLILLIWSALSILSGWFLIKLKKWPYVLGIVVMSLSIVVHLLALAKVGTTRWYSLILSIAVLVLLIVGRKSFRK